MPKSFMQLVEEAKSEARPISAQEAAQRVQQDPKALIVDVRDADEVRQTSAIPGALNISLGMLPVRADKELPEQFRSQELQDRSRPVMVTCALGLNAARGAKLLQEMGFADVHYIDGGLNAWKEAGLPTQPGSTS